MFGVRNVDIQIYSEIELSIPTFPLLLLLYLLRPINLIIPKSSILSIVYLNFLSYKFLIYINTTSSYVLKTPISTYIKLHDNLNICYGKYPRILYYTPLNYYILNWHVCDINLIRNIPNVLYKYVYCVNFDIYYVLNRCNDLLLLAKYKVETKMYRIYIYIICYIHIIILLVICDILLESWVYFYYNYSNYRIYSIFIYFY